jgi:hypothetical protein
VGNPAHTRARQLHSNGNGFGSRKTVYLPRTGIAQSVHMYTEPQQCPLLSLFQPSRSTVGVPTTKRFVVVASHAHKHIRQIVLDAKSSIVVVWSVCLFHRLHRRINTHTVCRQVWPRTTCLRSTGRTSIYHAHLPTALKYAHIHHVSVTAVHQQSIANRKPPGSLPTPSLVGCCSFATCHVAFLRSPR